MKRDYSAHARAMLWNQELVALANELDDPRLLSFGREEDRRRTRPATGGLTLREVERAEGRAELRDRPRLEPDGRVTWHPGKPHILALDPYFSVDVPDFSIRVLVPVVGMPAGDVGTAAYLAAVKAAVRKQHGYITQAADKALTCWMALTAEARGFTLTAAKEPT